jgi:hypothetical protein
LKEDCSVDPVSFGKVVAALDSVRADLVKKNSLHARKPSSAISS